MRSPRNIAAIFPERDVKFLSEGKKVEQERGDQGVERARGREKFIISQLREIRYKWDRVQAKREYIQGSKVNCKENRHDIKRKRQATREIKFEI